MACWKQKQLQRTLYNQSAHIYNRRYQIEQSSKYKAILDHLEFSSANAILDLGCGTGLILSKLDGAKEIVGLDISREMLRVARKASSNIESTHLVLGDADHVPLRCCYFDVVFAITLLQNMPDPAATLQEIMRTSKQDASIVITTMKIHFSERHFRELLPASWKVTLMSEGNGEKWNIAICKKDGEATKYPKNPF